jgi:glycosyltransferase involved in cell wall biosynthesis
VLFRSKITRFDVGIHPIVPTSYNNLIALPNKFFEFIAAGLAVCIGPSPSMAEIVREYHCGVIAPSFEAADIAEVLNRTTAAQWDEMKQASLLASQELNADHEMKKLLDIYQNLFG